MLDVQGNLWVTDFGLARLQDDAGLTITGDLLGTLRYMSPEQALAKRGYLDHRTDIYSLGATLYELVTLRPAIDGQDRQEVLRKIAQDEPTPPRRLNPSIPRELETILLKAMNKEPESRYATAQELADDLRRFLEDKPIKAKRPSLVEQVGEVVATASVDRGDSRHIGDAVHDPGGRRAGTRKPADPGRKEAGRRREGPRRGELRQGARRRRPNVHAGRGGPGERPPD